MLTTAPLNNVRYGPALDPWKTKERDSSEEDKRERVRCRSETAKQREERLTKRRARDRTRRAAQTVE